MDHNPVSIVIFLVFALTINYSSADNNWGTNSPPNDIHCPDLKPQSSLDLEQIMGKWYVVEVIEHRTDPMRLTSIGHSIVETCPTIKLRSTGRSTLKLRWSTEKGDLDYSFNVPDLLRGPGFWISKDLQNGTLLTKDYIHFVGIVQVMKAIASHMVLTFCSRTPDNRLYSVLLSREHELPENDVLGIRDLLRRRRLTLVSIKETCAITGNGKESSYVTRWTILVVLTAAVTALASSYYYTTTIYITTRTSF